MLATTAVLIAVFVTVEGLVGGRFLDTFLLSGSLRVLRKARRSKERAEAVDNENRFSQAVQSLESPSFQVDAAEAASELRRLGESTHTHAGFAYAERVPKPHSNLAVMAQAVLLFVGLIGLTRLLQLLQEPRHGGMMSRFVSFFVLCSSALAFYWVTPKRPPPKMDLPVNWITSDEHLYVQKPDGHYVRLPWWALQRASVRRQFRHYVVRMTLTDANLFELWLRSRSEAHDLERQLRSKLLGMLRRDA